MPGAPSVATELIDHGVALRRLARDLVGRCDAEDLVQETAVRALRSPPPVPHGLFSWLATVMRNLAANKHRDDASRRQRESALTGNAGNGEGPAADEGAVQRDTVRAVTDALWALPEPYQRTLVQRYFEELSPSAIGKRAGVPVATVKSRLQRGLELLRQAMERRDGRAWRRALVPAFGLAASAPWFAPAMSAPTVAKCAAVIAACAVAAWTWWAVTPEATGPSPAIAAVAADAASRPLDGGDGGTLATREAFADAAHGAVELAQPYELELRARVVGADGLPLSGARIAIAPPSCALALAEPATDADGRVTLKWRARSKELVMAVGLDYRGDDTSLQQVTVVAGAPAEIGFVAGIAPLPAHVTVDEYGRQIVTMPACSQGKADCRSCHEEIRGPALFYARGSLRAGLHPDTRFGDRLVPEAVEDPEHGDPGGFDDFTVGLEAPHSAMPQWASTISGRVFCADGTPAVGVPVQLVLPDSRGGGWTDAQGAYTLGVNPAGGPVTLHAGGGPEGLATCTIEVAGGRTTAPDLILATGRTLRGSVRSADGKPLNGARVEYVAPAGSDGDVAAVGPDGAFAFANLPPGPGRLLVWGVKGERFPIAEEPSVLPDIGTVDIDLRQRGAANGGLRLLVRGHDGEPTLHGEVRAWQQQTKRGSFLEAGEDGAFQAHGLMAGFYRVEVGALASGFRDLGAHWVDGTGVVDLGTVQLSQPARLHIDAVKDAKLELYADRADLVVRADEITAATRDVLLPPGRWLALWREGERLIVREAELVAGATTTLSITR